MEIGIVGLPNVGKSTLFNSLTSGHAASSNYPFTTIEPNVGVVLVPDPRLQRLTEIFHSEKTVPAAIKFVDIAGLVKGAAEGAGLGNQFLANIREVDAIVQVVRLFEDPDVVHTLGEVDPLRDIEVIETELCLSDLQSVEKQLDRATKEARGGDKDAKARQDILEKVKAALDKGLPARSTGISAEDLKPFMLLTAKPVLYVGNEDESPSPKSKEFAKRLFDLAQSRGAKALTISGKIEAEIAALPTEEDRKTFRDDMGLKETGLEKLIREAYSLLGLITFLTAGPIETHGWTVLKGSTAVQAAGRIHSDIAKGFIKADVYKFSDIDQHGSEKALQEKGLKRSEGRDYIVQDGDVCYFHFRS
jgi:GTP-binding protein YchF